MNTIIVGGEQGKESGIVRKIGETLKSITIEKDEFTILNGFEDKIPEIDTITADLLIWMPNIPNEEEKHYPFKNQGSVLICSKVMRENYRDFDAVSRIFEMHGNAVIAIYDKENRNKYFKLIDALSNIWYEGDNIVNLCTAILGLYIKTKETHRISAHVFRTAHIPKKEQEKIKEFQKVYKDLSHNIHTSCGSRFFGNISTRCQHLFPSIRSKSIYVSPRNIDKSGDYDLLEAFFNNKGKLYYNPDGNQKPSIDTPTQLTIYNSIPSVNYIIHGHAFIRKAQITTKYLFCGDVLETNYVIPMIRRNPNKFGAINLKNHGFIIYADTLDNLKEVIKNSEFTFNKDEI